jgi:DNA-binding response OmpR family regulator
MAHILLVDDDAPVLRSIQRILEQATFTVTVMGSGKEALNFIQNHPIDLVVLDIIMPEINGLEVCRQIRASPFIGKMPILFLTAKGRPTDIAQGLDAGGDDFLTKPFDVIELPARVRALLRRAPGGGLDTTSDYLTAGKLKISTTRPEIYVDNRRIELTTLEHRIMYYLMQRANKPVLPEQLLADVWQYPSGSGDPTSVRVHIANLRGKIEPVPEHPQYLRNVRGQGYMVTG